MGEEQGDKHINISLLITYINYYFCVMDSWPKFEMLQIGGGFYLLKIDMGIALENYTSAVSSPTPPTIL